MGQRMCPSESAAVRRRPAPVSAGGDDGEPVCVLPQEEQLLGRCWLLASSADAFSPSRWFCPSSSTLHGARSLERRAFSISPAVLSRSARRRHPVLRDMRATVHTGLTVCGFINLSIATMPAAEAQLRRSLRVGGVHVELPKLDEGQGGGRAASPPSAPDAPSGLYIILVCRRVSVEMEPRDHISAGYTRHPVRAPPACEEDRETYGEGCITGLLYGAAVVLHARCGSAAAELAELCTAAAEVAHIPGEALQVQLEGATSPAATATTSTADSAGSAPLPCLLSAQVSPAEADTLRGCFAGASREAEVLQAVASWAVRVHQRPSAWVPLNLFLQRYEAIGECLLHCAAR